MSYKVVVAITYNRAASHDDSANVRELVQVV